MGSFGKSIRNLCVSSSVLAIVLLCFGPPYCLSSRTGSSDPHRRKTIEAVEAGNIQTPVDECSFYTMNSYGYSCQNTELYLAGSGTTQTQNIYGSDVVITSVSKKKLACVEVDISMDNKETIEMELTCPSGSIQCFAYCGAGHTSGTCEDIISEKSECYFGDVLKTNQKGDQFLLLKDEPTEGIKSTAYCPAAALEDCYGQKSCKIRVNYDGFVTREGTLLDIRHVKDEGQETTLDECCSKEISKINIVAYCGPKMAEEKVPKDINVDDCCSNVLLPDQKEVLKSVKLTRTIKSAHYSNIAARLNLQNTVLDQIGQLCKVKTIQIYSEFLEHSPTVIFSNEMENYKFQINHVKNDDANLLSLSELRLSFIGEDGCMIASVSIEDYSVIVEEEVGFEKETQACPDALPYSYQDNCYGVVYLEENPFITRDEAEDLCISYGGHLVEIDDELENQFVSALLPTWAKEKRLTRFWIALGRWEYESMLHTWRWSWPYGDSYPSYQAWLGDTEPNMMELGKMNQPRCAFMLYSTAQEKGYWVDSGCDGPPMTARGKRGAICEKWSV